MSEQTTRRQVELDALAYVRSIRNYSKREYAKAYLDYCLGKTSREPEPFDLSYMAAQAVRMNFYESIQNSVYGLGW